MSLMIETTEDDLRSLRAQILNELGMSYPAFVSIVETGNLTGDQWGALVDLNNIAFLLGEDKIRC